MSKKVPIKLRVATRKLPRKVTQFHIRGLASNQKQMTLPSNDDNTKDDLDEWLQDEANLYEANDIELQAQLGENWPNALGIDRVAEFGHLNSVDDDLSSAGATGKKVPLRQPKPSRPPLKRPRLVRYSEMHKYTEAVEWLLDGVLVKNVINCIAAEPGIGKSTFVLMLKLDYVTLTDYFFPVDKNF